MPSFVAIMKWDAENRVGKSMPFSTRVEADAHIAAHIGAFPDAFVAVDPPAQVSDLLVDPVTKIVSLSVLPPPPPPTKTAILDQTMSTDEPYRGLLRAFAKQQGLTEAAMRALVEAEMA